jgi:hypothetical protein
MGLTPDNNLSHRLCPNAHRSRCERPGPLTPQLFRSTHAGQSCYSRSSPNAKYEPSSRSRRTFRLVSGDRCFLTRAWSAIVDRVTVNAHILETGTQSYRLRTSKTSTRRKRAS